MAPVKQSVQKGPRDEFKQVRKNLIALVKRTSK